VGHLLGIDAGTTSLKAGVFSTDGATLAVAAEEYRLATPRPERAELDPERYWTAAIAASRRAIENAGSSRDAIDAVAVSSQGETVTAVDADGEPLGPTIVWLDNRARTEADDLARRFEAAAIYAATGVPDINPTWTACKLLWWKHHEPDLFARASRFLLVEDLLLHRLTGRFVTEGGVQCTTLLYDIRTHGWWTPMLDALDLDPRRLPEIAAPGEVVGTLRPEAADALGLRSGVRIVAGGMDQGAGAVGVSNIGPGILSGHRRRADRQASVDRPDGDRTGRTPVYVHPAPGGTCTVGLSDRRHGITWFRDRFGQAEVARRRPPVGRPTTCWTTWPRWSPWLRGLTMPHLMGAFSPEYAPGAGVWFGFTWLMARATSSGRSRAVAYISGVTWSCWPKPERPPRRSTRTAAARGDLVRHQGDVLGCRSSPWTGKMLRSAAMRCSPGWPPGPSRTSPRQAPRWSVHAAASCPTRECGGLQSAIGAIGRCSKHSGRRSPISGRRTDKEVAGTRC
jgi:xylulokinase